MRLDNIITALSKEDIHIVQFGNLQINIRDFHEYSWEQALSEHCAGKLYIIREPFSQQPAAVREEELTLLCLQPEENILAEFCQYLPNATIILVENNQILKQVTKIIKKQLHINYVALERLEEAYHAVFSGANFQHLTEIGSRIFGNPVFILDSLGNYIAFPPIDKNESHIIQQERQRGHILKTDLEQLKQLKIDQILQETGKPYLFANPILKHRTLVDFIRLNGTVLGRLMVYEQNQPITEEDMIVFMHFSRLIALAFTHDRNYLMNKEASYSYFLQALVDRHDAKIAVSNQQIEKMKLNILNYKRVLVISFIDQKTNETNRLVIAQQLQKLLSNALYMFYENKLVFLVSGQQKNFLQKNTEELFQFCKTANLHLSTSHIFYDFTLFRQMFQQASQVDQIVQKYHLQGHLFSYRYLSSLITLDLHRTSYPAFIHPDILKLLEHDQAKNSQLLATLAHYILFNQEIDTIAQCMWLHANTLRYRIKQIKKILQNDLKDWLLLKTYYDSLVQLFQVGDISNQDWILKNDLNYL